MILDHKDVRQEEKDPLRLVVRRKQADEALLLFLR